MTAGDFRTAVTQPLELSQADRHLVAAHMDGCIKMAVETRVGAGEARGTCAVLPDPQLHSCVTRVVCVPSPGDAEDNAAVEACHNDGLLRWRLYRVAINSMDGARLSFNVSVDGKNAPGDSASGGPWSDLAGPLMGTWSTAPGRSPTYTP